MPKDYWFPASTSGKTRDWKVCWFLLKEFGVATIPASGKQDNSEHQSCVMSNTGLFVQQHRLTMQTGMSRRIT